MPSLPKVRNPAPEVERRIHQALAEQRRKSSKSQVGVVWLSQIGDCERNLWAAAHGIEEEGEMDSRMLVLFELGRSIEDHVIQLLRQADYVVSDRDATTGEQYRISALDGQAVGRIDGKILLGRKNFEKAEAVLEVKSAKKDRFEELQAVGYEPWNPKYAETIHAYMGFMEIPLALVVVYCKDDSRLYCERIRLDLSQFEKIQGKLRRIIGSDAVLPRPKKAESQYCGFCKYCPRNEWCWGPLSEVSFDA